MIFAPRLMTGLFHAFTGASAPFFFPGAAHFAARTLVVCALATVRIVLRRRPAGEESRLG